MKRTYLFGMISVNMVFISCLFIFWCLKIILIIENWVRYFLYFFPYIGLTQGNWKLLKAFLCNKKLIYRFWIVSEVYHGIRNIEAHIIIIMVRTQNFNWLLLVIINVSQPLWLHSINVYRVWSELGLIWSHNVYIF